MWVVYCYTVGAKEILTLLKRRKKITAKQGIEFHILLLLYWQRLYCPCAHYKAPVHCGFVVPTYRAHLDVYIATSKRQTNATLTANAAAIYKRQSETQPSASCARNISLSITHEQHKALWKIPRHIQKDIHKLRTFQQTRGQIIDNDNQCYYCKDKFTRYTDHYILHCSVTRRYRERLYTKIQHYQGNTSTRTSSIMKTQAARHHKELITLTGKFPIMQ